MKISCFVTLFLLCLLKTDLLAQAAPDLAEIDAKFERDSVSLALSPYLKAVSELNRQYLAALERALTTARGRRNAAEVLAVEQERDSIQAGKPVPKIDYQGTHSTVATTRQTYRASLKLIERERDRKMSPIIHEHSSARRRLITDLLKSGQRAEAQQLQSTMRALYPAVYPGQYRIVGNWKVYFNDRKEATWSFKQHMNMKKYFDVSDGKRVGLCNLELNGKYVVFRALGYWKINLTSDNTFEGNDTGSGKMVGERVP